MARPFLRPAVLLMYRYTRLEPVLPCRWSSRARHPHPRSSTRLPARSFPQMMWRFADTMERFGVRPARSSITLTFVPSPRPCPVSSRHVHMWSVKAQASSSWAFSHVDVGSRPVYVRRRAAWRRVARRTAWTVACVCVIHIRRPTRKHCRRVAHSLLPKSFAGASVRVLNL